MLVFCPNGHENPDSNRFCQECGSQIVAAATSQLTAGVLLGERYRITKEIGQGGFGRTYLCEDVNRFNERCVLKEFAPQVQGTALLTKAQQLFEREAGVMYRLQHPQIPMFREMFRVSRNGVGQLFLVQDFVEGHNYQELLLQKRRAGKTFTEAEITEFLRQILPVLGYIHSVGVIHRDISPDNLIQRRSDNLPVLIDFGGVKQVAVNAATQYMPSPTGNSEVPTRLGKVGYAPNEQMQRGVVSPQSDLYALAATALVLLTGREPPDLIDPQNFTWNWREHTKLSPNLGGILDRMLELRPQDRFSSAQEIITALGAPAEPPPTPAPPQPEPASQQRTVAVFPKPQPSPAASNSPAGESPLAKLLGNTWAIVAAVFGAIALGWLVAKITTSRKAAPIRTEALPQPTASPIASTTPATIAIAPTATTTPSPTPSAASVASIATIELTPPAALQGINHKVYGDAVKQVFTYQNPQVQIASNDQAQVRSRLESISNQMGDRLSKQLSSDAIRGIGKYDAADRLQWRSQVNNLHLGERAALDLADAKYNSITDVSAQKLGLKFDRFVNTPLGQIYQAAMFDRTQAIKSKQILEEIVFPIGGTSGTVSGNLQPGEGKAYIASLMGNQDISVEIKSDDRTNLSIYPPSKNLPTILAPSPTNNWSGKTKVGGYHEFILVSASQKPLNYELKLTAADLKPTQGRRSTPSPTSSNDDRSPLF